MKIKDMLLEVLGIEIISVSEQRVEVMMFVDE